MVLQNHTPYVLILVNSDDEPVATLPPSGHEIRVSFVPPVYLQAVGIPVPVLAPPSDGEPYVLNNTAALDDIARQCVVSPEVARALAAKGYKGIHAPDIRPGSAVLDPNGDLCGVRRLICYDTA
jgi:hypothetical protein